MIQDAMRQIQEVRRESKMGADGSGDIRGEVGKLHASLATMQQEILKTNTRLSALRVDVLGNAANVVVLQEQAEKASDGVNQLREGQKVTNTNMHNLREDLLAAKEKIKHLEKDVAHLQETKKNVLQAKLDRALLALQQSQEDLEGIKTLTFQNQDACHELRETLGEAQADVGKLEVARNSHESRIMELASKTDKHRENLEMTNGVVMKLHCEHEETRAKAIGLQTSSKTLDTALQRLREDHKQVVQSVQIVNEEAAKLSAAHSTTREMIVQTTDKVGGIDSGTVNLQNAVHELGKNIEWVHSVASHTQDHLKMTNALVLPNLGSDGAISPSSMGGTSGSAFASQLVSVNAMNSTRGTDVVSSRGSAQTCRSTPRRGSPRRRKEAAWFSRNIGSVPDRMSWI